MCYRMTEIEFVPIHSREGLIGFASFVWDNALKVSGIGVHTRLSGSIRLVYPSGKFGSLVFPIKKEIGDLIEKSVQQKINQLLYSDDRK